MKSLFLFLCLTLSLSLSARAEYRAFLLEVKDGDGNVIKTFKSSLDPDQYRGFYPLPQGESISYIDTWMCHGRTGNFQPICPSPREVMGDDGTSQRVPASAPAAPPAAPTPALAPAPPTAPAH